ncbi:MAG: hypothetical protein ACPGOV_15190 [Magnetovibrionaceae bacterium]
MGTTEPLPKDRQEALQELEAFDEVLPRSVEEAVEAWEKDGVEVPAELQARIRRKRELREVVRTQA